MSDEKGDPSVPRTEFESLHAFQRVMWDKLHANRHKGAWTGHLPEYLLQRVREETDEMAKALHDLKQCVPGSAREREMQSALTKEAADVANFAMMLADVCGGLTYRRVGG